MGDPVEKKFFYNFFLVLKITIYPYVSAAVNDKRYISKPPNVSRCEQFEVFFLLKKNWGKKSGAAGVAEFEN